MTASRRAFCTPPQYRAASFSPPAGPRTISWLRVSLPGLSKTGFMTASGSIRHACACAACARPISAPDLVTKEFSDMFCALNGATSAPRSEEHTSELQSRQYLVCRLLLEKKKQVHLFR